MRGCTKIILGVVLYVQPGRSNPCPVVRPISIHLTLQAFLAPLIVPNQLLTAVDGDRIAVPDQILVEPLVPDESSEYSHRAASMSTASMSVSKRLIVS